MGQIRLQIFELGQSPDEKQFDGDSISIGRTPDNDVSLPNDANISRRHARIDNVGNGEYWIFDLESSNGTFVNDEPVADRKILKSGDLINVGGASVIEFRIVEEEIKSQEQEMTTTASGNTQTAAQTPENKPKISTSLAVAAVASGLAIVSLTGGGLYLYTANSGCNGEIAFLQNQMPSTISEPTELKIKTTNQRCIQKVIYQLDGEPIETVEAAPFTFELTPKPEFDNDAARVLTAVVVDKQGKSTLQKDKLILEFDSPKKAKPPETSPAVAENTPPRKTISGSKINAPGGKANVPGGIPNAIETRQMAENLIRQFSGVNYKFDPKFLEEVRKKTAEYRSDGYFERAAQETIRDSINKEFVAERNLPPPLGFILAMSRSKFDTKPNGAEEGLWRMNAELAKTEVSYPDICGGGNLSEPSQKCAAIVSAEYTKRLIIDRFGGNIIYGIACFGMTMSEAGQFQISLSGKDLTDFSKIIVNPRQREQVVRFFAAGIVAENPQRFGLQRDRAISELYRNLMVR